MKAVGIHAHMRTGARQAVELLECNGAYAGGECLAIRGRCPVAFDPIDEQTTELLSARYKRPSD